MTRSRDTSSASLWRPAVALVALSLCAGCADDPGGKPFSASAGARDVGEAAAGALPPGSSGDEAWFTEAAIEAGLDFVHFNGMSGERYIVEILPPGVALLDYDGDDDLDVVLLQGQMLGEGTRDGALRPASGSPPLTSRVYRNDLGVDDDAGGSRTLRFTDVTAAAGIDIRGYPMGLAAGDVDNDGCVDLYVTSFDRNQLFRNNCDGTFTDISRVSGTDDPGWAVSAAFVDYDRDGWLDLFVGNYVHYTLDMDAECHNVAGARDYCTPQAFRAQADRLYRNRGDGTFAEVTREALAGGDFGPALGVATADYDDDGWIDIYVANDGAPNQLWMNQRNGTFRNAALLSGSAVSAVGNAEASMGVDAGDFDNDGDDDLFMTHLPSEGNNLYVNDGGAFFEELSRPAGLGTPSLGFTGFGTAWVDLDNDGWLDILTVNGAIEIVAGRPDELFPYDERNLVFRNMGDGRFADVTERAGVAFALSEVSRGAAFGDIDNDGDIDVLVGNNNGPVRLFVNHIGRRGRWLGLRLVGAQAPRDMLGAVVSVIRPAAPTLTRRVRSDGSYASANDPRVLIGLGPTAEPPTVSVRWPSGQIEEWVSVPVDRWTVLEEGSGQ